jgi:hypothetical protein
MKNTLREDTVYRFSRVSAPDMATYKPHPNSWLLTKALFDRVGGYDETYCVGLYGIDFDIRDRLARKAEIVTLKHPLIRVPREVVPDASTTTLPRKEGAGREELQRIKRAIAADPDHKPRRLTFAYSQVA